MLNEYSQAYLKAQGLAQCHLSKLQFSSAILAATEQQWQAYLEQIGFPCLQGIKLVTEAALLGSAIEHGLSPELIVISDGAKQFANKSACPVLGSHGTRHSPTAWGHRSTASRD